MKIISKEFLVNDVFQPVNRCIIDFPLELIQDSMANMTDELFFTFLGKTLVESIKSFETSKNENS